MSTIIDTSSFSPISFPELEKLGPQHSCRPECIKAAQMIGGTAYCDDKDSIYLWEPEYDRLWILGWDTAVVAYFSPEYGVPFFYRVDSLLKRSRVAPFDFEAVLWHLSISVTHPFPCANDELESKDGYPEIYSQLEKDKLLPASARKFLRQTYCQLVFTKIGFEEPSRDRYNALRLLLSATADTTLATALRLGPEYHRRFVVEGEVSHEKKQIDEKDTVLENEKPFEIISVGSPVSKTDPHGMFCEPKRGWDQVADGYIREEDGTISRETVVLENEKAHQEGQQKEGEGK